MKFSPSTLSMPTVKIRSAITPLATVAYSSSWQYTERNSAGVLLGALAEHRLDQMSSTTQLVQHRAVHDRVGHVGFLVVQAVQVAEHLQALEQPVMVRTAVARVTQRLLQQLHCQAQQLADQHQRRRVVGGTPRLQVVVRQVLRREVPAAAEVVGELDVVAGDEVVGHGGRRLGRVEPQLAEAGIQGAQRVDVHVAEQVDAVFLDTGWAAQPPLTIHQDRRAAAPRCTLAADSPTHLQHGHLVLVAPVGVQRGVGEGQGSGEAGGASTDDDDAAARSGHPAIMARGTIPPVNPA